MCIRDRVVNLLRAAGEIQAARIDTDTGEWVALSEAAIRRGLRQHGYTFALMTAPSPTTRLRSPHPNWCWQIDASVSRQFYLADSGAQVMDKAVYYRGKPGNSVSYTHLTASMSRGGRSKASTMT